MPKIDDAPPLSFEEHFDLNSYVESQAIEIERQIKDLASTRIAKIVESWVLPMTGFLLAAIWIYLSSFHFPAPGEIPQFVWVVGGVDHCWCFGIHYLRWANVSTQEANASTLPQIAGDCL